MIMEEWSERCNIADFESEGKEPGTKKCAWPLAKLEKNKETDFFPGSSRKKCISASNLILAQWYKYQKSDLQSCKIINALF